MTSQDEEKQTDISALLKKIRGACTPDEKPAVPATPPPEETAMSEETDSQKTGDFSELIKKLNLGTTASVPESVPEKQEVPNENVILDAERGLSDDDALFEALPDQATEEESPGQELSGSDVREVLGKFLAQSGTVPKPASPPEEEEKPSVIPSEPIPREPAVEIIDQDPREHEASSFFKKRKAARNAEAAKSVKSEQESDDRVISADQISELSGLILPKGATFQIEEIKLRGGLNAFENTGTGTLPPELADIWQREFSTAGFKDLESELALEEDTLKKAAVKKSGFSALFSAIRSAPEEYDPKIHGPLVDLSFEQNPGIEEMEMYPVNEPYAYVRVIYDHATHEYTYQVIEPVLSEPEKDLLAELKDRLFETLDINTKDISKEEARRQLRASVDDILADYGIKLTPVQREKIHYNMHKDFLGDGLIDAIMHDKYIEDISCDGVNTPIFAFHSSYESMKTTLM